MIYFIDISQPKNKISIKNFYPKNKEMKRCLNINNNSARNYHPPIRQYIYRTRTNDNLNTNNIIYKDGGKYIQASNFKFLDKNENSLKNDSSYKENSEIMKNIKFNIIKKNQKKNLNDIEKNKKYKSLNVNTEIKRNKKEIYINLCKAKKLFVNDNEVNSHYRTINFYGNNKEM